MVIRRSDRGSLDLSFLHFQIVDQGMGKGLAAIGEISVFINAEALAEKVGLLPQ